jgi:hypothetical protein
MQSKLKNILLVLLVAFYFLAANGMVLHYVSQWYSTGGEVAIAFHSGPSKDLPVASLTERTYIPQTSQIVVLSIALLAHAVVYPVERPVTYAWIEDRLPSYTAVISSSLADRAPPAA